VARAVRQNQASRSEHPSAERRFVEHRANGPEQRQGEQPNKPGGEELRGVWAGVMLTSGRRWDLGCALVGSYSGRPVITGGGGWKQQGSPVRAAAAAAAACVGRLVEEC